MEVVKARKGRVSAAKHATRRVTVHYRTEPVLTQDWAERPQTVADWALVAVAALSVSGILPMLAASALIAFVDTLPMWSQLPLCMALFLAAMWLFVRVGVTGGVR